MKILVLSFYYEPDLCAGSFRCTSLVEQLKLIPGIDLEVVTTMPNRYSSFTDEALAFEQHGSTKIHRISLPSHQSGMLDQVKAFKHFYRKSKALTKKSDYDLVFATSSRLFTAYLGARIAANKKLPLYLDIRDIFVDTIKDVLNPKLAFIAKPILTLIERYTFGNAQHINLVSEGFSPYFKKRYAKPSYTFFTNGIDQEFLDFTFDQPKSSSLPQIVYAGNLGEGQGLQNIIPSLASSLAGKAEIKIIGDGGRKTQLQDALVLNAIDNVTLLSPVTRKELVSIYENADVLFLHLNDYPAFEKVLPSKIFEYGATGKPILAGVAGFSAHFIQNELKNAEVFNPGCSIGASEAFERLNLVTTPREDFTKKYKRKNIMKNLAASITSIVGRKE